MLSALPSTHHILKETTGTFFIAHMFDEPYIDWRRWSGVKLWKAGTTEAEKWPRNLNFSNHGYGWIQVYSSRGEIIVQITMLGQRNYSLLHGY